MDFFIILVQVVWTRKGLQMKGSDKHQMTYEESSGRVSTPAIEKGWREKQRQRSSRLSKYIQLLAALAV